MSAYPQGSQWAKWDLHIHTPASIHWKGQKYRGATPAQAVELTSKTIEAIQSADVVAVATMDYFTFDGYVNLRKALLANPTLCQKTIFPGMELRIEATTEYRLNMHVILSDKLTPQQLADFKLNLKLATSPNRSLSDEALIEFARQQLNTSDIQTHGMDKNQIDTNDDYALKCAAEVAEISKESLKAAIKSLPEDSVIIMCPWDTYCGLSKFKWQVHIAAAKFFMEESLVFETRSDDNIDLFQGRRTEANKSFQSNFMEALGGRPKAVCAGSDAHKWSDYGKFPSDKATWYKAEPTFEGLLQVTIEPVERAYIGQSPDKLNMVKSFPSRFISGLRIEKVNGAALTEKWFDGTQLQFNPDLIAVIGNKGSGKSALADIIALGGNAVSPDMEFLTSNRFKRPREDKASSFLATLLWADGNSRTFKLSDEWIPTEPERVRYLPQQYIEKLCNQIEENSAEDFENELKKIIFSHIDEEYTLGLTSLDEVVHHRTEEIEKSITGYRAELAIVNGLIQNLENQLDEKTIQSLNATLKLIEGELQELTKAKPPEEKKPGEAIPPESKAIHDEFDALGKESDQILKRLTELRVDYGKHKARASAIERLQQGLANLRAEYSRTGQSLGEDAKLLGLQFEDLATLTIKDSVLSKMSEETGKKLGEIRTEAGDDAKGLKGRLKVIGTRRAVLESQIAAPFQKYEQYLKSLQEWEKKRTKLIGDDKTPGTKAFLEAEIKYVSHQAKQELQSTRESREELTRKIIKEIQRIREIYSELYSSIQQFIDAHEFVKQELHLEFKVQNDASSFPEEFLGFIDQGRKGSFYGRKDGLDLLRRLMEIHGYETQSEIENLLSAIMAHLNANMRFDPPETCKVADQLMSGLDVEELYNYLYGLSFLRPRYGLSLKGRELNELSPGERGIMLLIFYLMLDKDEIPLIIDQPEHNLDNESIFKVLVKCIRDAKKRRQIVIVTHNANLAVVCDAEQIICASHKIDDFHAISYEGGAIENPPTNMRTIDILEGTWPAFKNRLEKYMDPT